MINTRFTKLVIVCVLRTCVAIVYFCFYILHIFSVICLSTVCRTSIDISPQLLILVLKGHVYYDNVAMNMLLLSLRINHMSICLVFVFHNQYHYSTLEMQCPSLFMCSVCSLDPYDTAVFAVLFVGVF